MKWHEVLYSFVGVGYITVLLVYKERTDLFLPILVLGLCLVSAGFMMWIFSTYYGKIVSDNKNVGYIINDKM